MPIIDVGSLATRIRDVVGTAVEETTATVARLFAGDTAPAPTQADTALHNVASQVRVELTPEEERQVGRGVEAVFQRTNYGYPAAAIELARQLRGHSAEYRAEFMRRFYQTSPPVASDILRGAADGGRHHVSEPFVGEADRRTVATALGEAYDRGLLPPDFVGRLLQGDSTRMPPNNEYSGAVVALSGSQSLINAYVDRSLELAQGREPEWIQSFNLGAARAMAGDPEILRQRLERMGPDGMRDFLAKIDPRWHDTRIGGYDSGYTNALASFVRGAARIEPPDEQVLNLFREAAAKYTDRAGVSDALAEVFTAGHTEQVRLTSGRVEETVSHPNSEFLLHRMLAGGRDPVTGEYIDEASNLAALRNFFQSTAFNDYSPYKDAVRAQLTGQIRSLQSAADDYPAVDSRTRELIGRTIQPEPGQDPAGSVREQLAYRLGRLTASVFQGFEAAVRERGKENANIDGAVDFLFSIVPVDKATAVVTSRIPGSAPFASRGVDFLKGKVKEWLHRADLNTQRLEVWNLFAEFANNVATYHSDDFYSGAGSVDYTLQHSGR